MSSLLDDLQKATSEFVAKEKERIEKEVEALDIILKGRGKNPSDIAVSALKVSAENNLEAFLKGA